MMKSFFLLVALLGLSALGTASTSTRPEARTPAETEFGGCRFYCGSHPYTTLPQCAAACGGAQNCDEIC